MEGGVPPGRRTWRSRLGEGVWALLYRSGLLAAGRGVRRRLGGGNPRVLCYHRIALDRRASDLSPGRFKAHLAHLVRRYRVVPPLDLVRILASKAGLPRSGVAITFDDGYADLVSTALPLLSRYGIPAAVFVVTGDLPDSGSLWLDRLAGTRAEADRAGLARLPAAERAEVIAKAGRPPSAPPSLLNAAGIRELAEGGITIGSHSRTHPHLPALSDEEVTRELAGSRDELAEVLGEPPALLAWPWGAVDDRVAQIARRVGYQAAFATGGGAIREGLDLFRIPRIHVPGNAGVARMAAEAAGLVSFLKGVR